MLRKSARSHDALRDVIIEKDFVIHPEGSVLISIGQTKVICNATVEEKVPSFLRGSGKGWVSAEYSMLPRATGERTNREATKGKLSGRTMEIQRLIGRSLRAVIDLEALGERTVLLDCDVIQADGGTRTASITGAFVALVLALHRLVEEKVIEKLPITDFLAAISVGIVPEVGAVLDLDYEEDCSAAVDMNIVMTASGEFVELQGSGEEATFSMNELQEMLLLAESGIMKLVEEQRKILGDITI